MFLLNSWLDHFTETTLLWYALSRSYSVNLPSSFTMDHSSALGYSPRLPVSVYGTGCNNLTLEVFLGSLIRDIITSAEASVYYQVQHIRRIFLPDVYLLPLTHYSVSAQSFHYSVTPSKLLQVLEYSPVCHQLRLSALPKDPTNPDPISVDQEPLVLRRKDFSSFYRYLCLHFLFCTLQHTSRYTFDAVQNAPLPITLLKGILKLR